MNRVKAWMISAQGMVVIVDDEQVAWILYKEIPEATIGSGEIVMGTNLFRVKAFSRRFNDSRYRCVYRDTYLYDLTTKRLLKRYYGKSAYSNKNMLTNQKSNTIIAM